MPTQVANALSPTANYAAGQRWFTAEQAAKEHARALQHPETDFDPETGVPELHSALSSLNEATFETAQVGRQCKFLNAYWGPVEAPKLPSLKAAKAASNRSTRCILTAACAAYRQEAGTCIHEALQRSKSCTHTGAMDGRGG